MLKYVYLRRRSVAWIETAKKTYMEIALQIKWRRRRKYLKNFSVLVIADR